MGDLIIKNDGKVALQKTKKLLSITEKILAERKSRELLDTSWVKEIVKWSREFNLGLPESYKELIKVRGIVAKGRFAITKEWYQKRYPEKDLTEFYFSDTKEKKISYIPKEIGNLSNLKELSLYYNQIEEIPEWIGNLSNLKELSFNDNQIEEIPEWIGNLSNLKELSFNDNQIEEIPETIGNLSNLERLSFNDNQIEEIPEWIGNLSNLKWLDLGVNQIKEIPETIGNLSNLKWLYLEKNLLSDSEKSKISQLLPNTIEF